MLIIAQDKGQHLFKRQCPISGDTVIDEDRLSQFAENIKHEMDLDKNGTISKEVWGWACTWGEGGGGGVWASRAART